MDNGLLTPTLKVKRREVEARFKAMVDDMYARLEKLRWWDWPEAQVRRAIPLLQAGDLDALEKLV